MSMFDTFEFLRPHFLWLLVLFLVLPFVVKNFLSVSNAWEKVCDKILLTYLTGGKEKNKRKRFNFWIYLGFLSAIIALAGPSFRQTAQPVIVKETPLMIVLDLSSNMNRIESTLSRLSRAKIEISDILQKSNASPSGLIVYTYEPFLISPLAYDSNIIKNLLKAVNTGIMPLGGNKVDRALDMAVSKLKSGNYKEGNILLLTGDIPLDFDKALESAKNAVSEGYKISVYGLSSKTNEKLKKLAEAGEGIYINTGYASSENLIKLLKKTRADDYEENNNTVSVPEDDGVYFVFISLFCVLRLFLGGLFVFAALFLLPVDSYAGFFYNQNQEGALLFSSREYNKAADKFKNTDWKAAAYYKAGDYDAALKILKNKNDITSLYNKGNALAKSGKIKDAIKTYEDVLKQNPNHEDAKYNLEYLKRLAQQQQSEKNDEKKEDSDKNENQNQNQNDSDKNDKQNNDENQNSDNSNQNNDENQNQENSDENDNDAGDENQKQENGGENNKEDNQTNKAQNQDDDENNENQNQNESEPDEQKDEEPDENSDNSNGQKDKNENDVTKQQAKAPVLPAIQQKAAEYDETVQAREQRFRTIKEDTGGLLKAFIAEEYSKKRYDD